MDLGGDLPVTIVIKAPNQRIDDLTVDCMLGWTVKKLKEHLKSVYPNKPSEKHQKLIYSGKLLADHMTLKEVLRQFDDGSSRHTVHLVCSGPFSNQQTASMNQESQPGLPATPSSQSYNTEPVPDTSGLRYRGNNPASGSQATPQPAFVNPVNPNVFGAFNYGGQYSAGFPPEAMAAMYGGMSPVTGMAYTPEQYMWMQQAYSQYMAQYMQYYQQAGYPMQANVPSTGAVNEQNAENQNIDNNNPQEAQAAVDPDDGDDEFRQRDWLDYLYYFSRLMVLLGIVYFYSNVTRFIMVALFFLVVYFYQMGGGLLRWLPLPRRRVVQQQQQAAEEPQPEQQQADTEQENNTEDTNTDRTDSPTEAVQPQGPGALKLIWTFISTFFTSLFPAPPPPVNVN